MELISIGSASERVAPELEEGAPCVVATNIHKTYLLGVEGVPALRGVTLKITQGEFVIILGKSGGGKTSLLNVLGTIDKPTKGELLLAGKRISAQTTDQEFAHIRLEKIGFVFQTFNLISTMSAQENVELPMLLAGRLNKQTLKARAIELLNMVGMGGRLDHLPSQLSGGEQQRVTIARAMANNPSVLLLDEPTGDLDTKNSHVVLDMLLNLNRNQKITCIMVTHDQSLRCYAHRVVHMLDGKISHIEEILPEVRENADKALRETIAVEAVEKKELQARQELRTETRDPRVYYKYLPKKAASPSV